MASIGAHLDTITTPANERQARLVFREVLFVAIVLAVWISTQPFATFQTEGLGPTSNTVNQLVFSGLAALAGLALIFVHPRALAPLVQPSYALLLLALVVSVLNSTEPGISQRAFLFTLIVMFLGASLYVLPKDLARFQTLLFASSLITLGLAYFGVVALPDLGKHTDFDPFEPEHAGSWKGHFTHKNIAGAMVGVIALTGVYAIREGRRGLGAVLLIGGIVFLYFTKSKTSFALLPLALATAFFAERLRYLWLRLPVCLGPIVLIVFLTLGSVLVPEVAELNKAMLKDPSFTGRFDIWRYGFEKLAERPWGGFGFEAFWQTSTTYYGESKLELAWAAEKIVHGHNSYLDVALTLGLFGLAITAYAFIVKPIIDYHRATERGDSNRRFATYCLSVWLFVALGMALEVYFFRRADPVWFAFLIAVFGLRFSASLRFAPLPSPAARLP